MSFVDKMRVIRDNIRFNIYKLRYDYKSPFNEGDFNFDNIKHIVISKVDGKLGDTEVLSPFFKTLQKAFPNILISVITLDNLKAVYEDCIKVSNTIISPKKRPNKAQVQSFCKDIKKLGSCDLLIFLDEKVRPREFYLINELKPKFIAGTNSKLNCINIKININPQDHMSQSLNSILTKGGISDIFTSYIPFCNDSIVQEYKEQYKNTKVIGFTPYGGGVL